MSDELLDLDAVEAAADAVMTYLPSGKVDRWEVVDDDPECEPMVDAGSQLLYDVSLPLAKYLVLVQPERTRALVGDRREVEKQRDEYHTAMLFWMRAEADAKVQTLKWETRAKALWMRYHGSPLADDSDATWDAALTVRQD